MKIVRRNTMITVAVFLITACFVGFLVFRGDGGKDAIVKLDPPRPNPPSLGGDIADATSSYIPLPISVPIATLQALVNEKVPRQINQPRRGQELTRAIVEDWIEFVVDRRDITLTGDGPRLNASIPASGRFSGGGQFNPLPFLGRGIGVRETVTFNATISASGQAVPTPDWSIATDPRVGINVHEADLVLAGRINISVRGLLTDGFNENAPALVAGAAADAVAKLELRAKAEAAWAALQEPVKIATQPPTWLIVTPETVRLNPVTFGADNATTSVAIRANTRIVVSESVASRPVVPLPALMSEPGASDEFRLAVPVQISIDDLQLALKNAVVNKAIKLGADVEITPTDIALNTSGETVVLSLSITAKKSSKPRFSASGTIYLLGKLVLDPTSKELRLEQVEFDVETKSFLIRAAAWLLNDEICRQLQEKAKLDSTSMLAAASDKAMLYINSLSANNGPVKFEIFDLSMSLADLKVFGGEAFALFTANGRTSAVLR